MILFLHDMVCYLIFLCPFVFLEYFICTWLELAFLKPSEIWLLQTLISVVGDQIKEPKKKKKEAFKSLNLFSTKSHLFHLYGFLPNLIIAQNVTFTFFPTNQIGPTKLYTIFKSS